MTPALLLIAAAVLVYGCSRSNPASSCSAEEAKARCISYCQQDYEDSIPVCFSRFWDSDKRACIARSGKAADTCKARCE